jgi:hypothetical protein
MDLKWLIEHNPTQIHRTVALQKDGSVDLFEMRVTKTMDAGEIEAVKTAYAEIVQDKRNKDTFETRMTAISAAIRLSNGKLQAKHQVTR